MNRNNNLENQINKSLPFFKWGFIITTTIIVYRSYNVNYNKSEKENKQVWAMEDSLNFEGVITDYSGYGSKRSPVMLVINNSLLTSIPRPNNNFSLHVGDTIQKNKNEHIYYIKRTSFFKHEDGWPKDTVVFTKND